MSIRIGIGSGLGGNVAPDDYWRWVDLCEGAGIDSIWHSDQLLGATVEPMAMLAMLAARTKRMRFGMNAMVVAFRDPLVLAKECATIDWMSGGRLLPVFGVGNALDPYWAATGASPKDRGRRSNEAIALIRLLLEQEEVRFEGAHYRYHGPGVLPRPANRIPLWIGGNSQAAIDRTARLGDGWLGGITGSGTTGDIRQRIEAALKTTGRSIDADHYGVTLPMRIGERDDPAVARTLEMLHARTPPEQRAGVERGFAVGSTGQIIELLRGHVAAGMSKFVMVPLANDAADLMDQTRRLASEILPAIEDR